MDRCAVVLWLIFEVCGLIHLYLFLCSTLMGNMEKEELAFRLFVVQPVMRGINRWTRGAIKWDDSSPSASLTNSVRTGDCLWEACGI